MKKFLVLVLAAMMAFSCVAHAASILDADPEDILVFDRESPVTDWVGTWKLAAAYISEEFANDAKKEEDKISVTGWIAVPENALTMTVEVLLDASATGSPDGVLVDTANYYHAHVYDMEAALTFDESITADGGKLGSAWDQWPYEVRGEQDGDFNKGVAKLSTLSPKDKTLYFGAITGVKHERISDEKMKYIGMTVGGQLVVCFSDDKLNNKDGDFSFAYIFVRAE